MADAKEGSDLIGDKIIQRINLKAKLPRELSGAGAQNEIYAKIRKNIDPYQKYFQECAQIIAGDKSRRYKEDSGGLISAALQYLDRDGNTQTTNLALRVSRAESFWRHLAAKEKKYKCTWAKINSLIINFDNFGRMTDVSFDPEVANDRTFQRALLEKNINHIPAEDDPPVDRYYLYFNDPRTMGVFVYAGGYKGRRIVDEQGNLGRANDTFEQIVNQSLHAFVPFDVSQPPRFGT